MSKLIESSDIEGKFSSVRGSEFNDTNMYVEQSNGSSGWKKLHFCYYCKTTQQKIARHLELMHKDVEDVRKFAKLPKGNAERKNIIAEIRKKGDFLFNSNEKFNNGKLIVSRRPQKKFERTSSDFAACAYCKGFFSKSAIRVHLRVCTIRKK